MVTDLARQADGRTDGATTFAEELCGRLEAVEAIDPVALADLSIVGFGASEQARVVRGALESFLVGRTLRHAHSHVPYYRARPSYAPHHPVTPCGADLAALPTIDRATVMGAHAEFIAENVHLRSVCHSSGTTGKPIEIYKSYEEVAFMSAFFTRLFGPAFRASPPVLSLSFPTPHHGVPLPFPSPGIGFVSGVTDDTLIADALRVLSTEYAVAGAPLRISRLSGMGFQVLFFTNYLLEQGVDPGSFGLGSVSVAGGFLPAHWRQFLARAWRCPINDRFSLTETVGGATRCDGCGRFRPDPQVLFEVLDIDSGQPLLDGLGKLVITNLYPFAQMMPLIRYETGDLVRLGRCACTGLPAFSFYGRLQNCISTGQGADRRWLLLSSVLHEILATIPDLNVYEWFSNVRVVKDRTVGSLPIVAVRHGVDERGKPWIRLEAELRYAPQTYPGRTRELRRRIVRGLSAEPHSSFAEDLAAGALNFEVRWLPPGGLAGDYLIKI